MAAISDIQTYLSQQAALAIYPNGTSSPSVAPVPPGQTNPMDVLIYVGWPIAQQLDLDMAGMMLPPGNAQAAPIPRPNGPRAHVSINVWHTSTKTPFQIQNHTYLITPAAINLTVTSSGTPGAQNCAVTITGTPASGEFVSIEADGHIYSRGGSTASAILSALLTDAQANFPAASLNSSTLTIPASYQFVVHQGGQGVQGIVTHRQCQAFVITTWAPDDHTRSVLSDAVDVLLKQTNVITMPDTSEARIVYSGMYQTSEMQNEAIYRRDIYYEVEYATLFEFPAYTVTTVTGTIDDANAAPPTPPADINFIIY